MLRALKRGEGETWCIWTGFCVRCQNVGSTNQIAVSGIQHKQHLNITCSKCTLVLFNHRSSNSTAIVPAHHPNCHGGENVCCFHDTKNKLLLSLLFLARSFMRVRYLC